jgi:beta-xylosidase
MKKLTFSLFILSIAFFSQAEINIPACSSPEEVPSNVLFGDPFVLVENGTYFMYGTSHKDGIEVYRSKDMITWEGPCGAREGLALHKNDVWGEKWFWAPEVFKIDNKFYMFYSADEHSAVAVSDNPLGPFTQNVQQPLLDFKAIDGSLFTDTDGKNYYYFVNFTPSGMQSWVAEINIDNNQNATIKQETMKKCIGQSQPWEMDQSVNEGPCVLKHEDTYFLVYSANAYFNQNYGLGFATAQKPKGPWTKYDKNPILQKPDSLVGVGHCQFFTGVDNQLYVVYHAHSSKTSVQPRKVYINPVRFTRIENTGEYRIEILPKRITPVLK